MLLDDASSTLLVEQCRALARHSQTQEAWFASQYTDAIKIGSQLTLHELHHHWAWYARTDTFKDDHKLRLKQKLLRYLKKHQKYYRGYVNTFPARATGPMWANAGVVMNEAYHRYWETGTMYTREHDIRNATHVNPLFAYSNGQQTFAMNDLTAPLATFLMADAFCSLHPSNSSTWPKPALESLHAVARSQFHTWCLCFRSCIQAKKVVLRHIYSDPLALGLTLQEYAHSGRASIACRVKPWRAAFLVLDGDGFSTGSDAPAPVSFDVIDTTNTSDTQGILNVLVACVPLLKHAAWAVLYTETRDVYGDEPVTESLVQLCGDLGTMSLLLDIAPTSYLSEFRTEANMGELVSRQLIHNVKGYVERLTWRRPSRLETCDRNLGVETEHMEDFLYKVCLKMFQREAVSPPDESEGSERERSRAHYCRRSFALLIRYLVSRVATNWPTVVMHVVERMTDSYDLMIAKCSIFDYVCQLYQVGVHSALHYKLGSIMQLDTAPLGRLRGWSQAPPVVWLAFSVPRTTFKVLDEEDAPHNPPISVGVGSEIGGESYHFPSFEPFFGTLSVEGHAERARAFITEDTHGRRGDSPIIVTFCMPTHLLARPEPLQMSVRLLVLKTPETTKFYVKYGNVGRFFELSTADPSVHVLAHPPTLRKDVNVAPLINPAIPRAVPGQDTVLLGFDSKRDKVVAMTSRADFKDPEMKAALADKKATPIDYEQTSYCAIRLKLGSQYQSDMSFPYPIDGTKIRIRLSRRESWVEVIAPPSPLGKSLNELSKDRFPMIADGNERAPWNIHRLSLGRLPQLSTKNPSMLQWVTRHVDFAFSETENEIRGDPREAKDTLTMVKSTISSIFQHFVGTKDTPGRSAVALARQDGSLAFMLLITGLRLDAAAHTVVLDAFVPRAATDTLRRLLEALRPKAARVTLSDDEVRAWSQLLPALAERCREWRHAPECTYLADEGAGEWMLCGCGEGRDADALKRKKDWAPFAPHATRVALGQLFAVSYLERMCTTVVKNMRPMLSEHGVPLSDLRLLLEEGGRDGKDHWDTYCALCLGWLPPGTRKICKRCKAQVYCSRECQQMDWANHKEACGEASNHNLSDS
ncbi:zinc finger MYND domain-containing protein [Phanerochaete sordida]|uniref:Zinc finger MYND domain-containing protein n=1 Tax=Phanerochaete sordida TaxID=48140 RepID=A0A9P3FZ32_9APHY|nr:zinc finger MYND domain-containing protein [Phanerochaete sordida]